MCETHREACPCEKRLSQPSKDGRHELATAAKYKETFMAKTDKPNILVIMGDDIGWFNPSCYNSGIMGYQTPNIDRIAQGRRAFTDWYGQQSCTAGRAAFITGQSPIRTGLTKVGLPGADLGLQAEDPSVADFMKNLGYATGQFGKNHLGRPRRVPADGPRLRRVLRQPLSPQRRGRAGEPRLPEGPAVQRRSSARAACSSASTTARSGRRSRTPAR